MAQLWGGRFAKPTEEKAREFLRSYPFDVRLARQDVIGSIAHARMLQRQGILSQEEGDQILRGLQQILEEVEEGQPPFDPSAEDVHTAVEVRLQELIGEVAGKLHTARSRNDQVVTDLRLWLREEGERTANLLRQLQGILLEQAGKHLETIMPGFTHLQHAQPVTLAHHLLAYFWMFQRDKERLRESLRRINYCPLGASALAGTPFPIDREEVARELGFIAPCPNSMDAVADRDFVVEFLAFSALTMMHLSRLAQEITLWSAPEFGFLILDDAYATGSSIMPQKKNPDVAELVRGKTGRVYGHLLGLLTVLKGLPLTYNTDLQEDKEALFDTVETLQGSLEVFTGMLKTATFIPDRMEQMADTGFIVATDVADFIAMQGVPFRQAHEIVGRIVLYCEREGKSLSALSLEELRRFWPGFPDNYRVPTVRESVASRKSFGGTAPERVREQLEEAHRLYLQDNP